MTPEIKKNKPSQRKRNCWEVALCGRQPGGDQAEKKGVCPASTDTSFDGINSGICGGRICWAVAGTFCGGCTQGSFEDKRASCLECDFYEMVQEEEGMANLRTKFLQYITRTGSHPFIKRLSFKHIRSGTRFIVQGEVEPTAYIIQRGSCLVVVEKDGELHPVDHYGEGDIVGGLGILTGEPRRAHVEAETDMDLWVLTKQQFDEISGQDPDLLHFITELVADRLDSRRPTAYRTIGKYVATDIIGRGAFSIVYKGEHKSLGMPVVIKMMRHDMALHSDFLDNFRNEARTIAGLSHENIVKVVDFDERYRTLFIIMEHIEGESLKEMIHRLKSLPPSLVVHFLKQLLSALEYAHQRGIIHRDINPSNIIARSNEQVKILDFGLACPIGTKDFANTGTAQYMAPEQINGDPLDPRTDIYALGVTAYEMVTGTCPFPEKRLNDQLDRHLTTDIPDPGKKRPELPKKLRTFIRQAGRRNPDQRFQDVTEALSALSLLESSTRLPHHSLEIEKRKMSTLCLLYNENNQLDLNRLMDDFCNKALRMGIEVKLADFRDLDL